MPAGKVYQVFIGRTAGIAASGHIRIIGPHQTDTAQIHFLQCFKVRLPAVVFPQIVGYDLCSEQSGERGVSRITGVGDQHLFAWIDESQGDVQDALLRSDKRLDFCPCINGNTVPPLIKACHGRTQLRRPCRWLITVSGCLPGNLAQFVYCLFRGRHIGTADGQRDDVLSVSIHLRHFLQFAREVVFLHFVHAACRLYHRLSAFYQLLSSRLQRPFPQCARN